MHCVDIDAIFQPRRIALCAAVFSFTLLTSQAQETNQGLPLRMVAPSDYVHERNYSQVEDNTSTEVRAYPAPQGAPVYSGRRVNLAIDGKSYPIPLYETPVWGGKAFHGSIDCNRPAAIEMTISDLEITNVVVRPLSKKIAAKISGNRIRFEIAGPGKYTIELNGSLDEAVHLFVNPVEKNAPSKESPGVVYYGPGFYENVGILKPKSGETWYIAGGAYLQKARFDLRQCENVVVRGRGVVDTGGRFSGYKRDASNYHCLSAYDTTNILVEGLTFLDAASFCTVYRRTQDLRVRNVKVIGKNGNTDQNDLVGTQRVHVSDTFLRGYDDGISVKIAQEARDLQSCDILAENLVIWTDLAHPLTVGVEILNTVHHVVFSNVDILHVREPAHNSRALAIHCGDYGTVHDIIFTDIRIESFSPPFANGGIDLIQLQIGPNAFSKSKMPGYIRNIVFRNITLLETPFKPSIEMRGFDEGHTIENVRIENVVVKGKRILSYEDAEFTTNAFVKNVTFSAGAAKGP